MGDARSEHRPSHIEDPGKEARSASGIPIVPVFDGYRAFAILGVVVFHMMLTSGVVGPEDHGLIARLTWGTVGRAVEILFVVSGFVVFLPTVARKGDFGDLGRYALRRGARLLPAYWMVLLIIVVLQWTVNIEPSAPSPDFQAIVIHFAGLQVPLGMFIGGIPMGFGVDQPLWTLSVEIMFYLVLPLIAARYFRRPFVGLAIAAAITIAWTLIFENIGEIVPYLNLNIGFGEVVRLIFASKLQLMTWALSFALGMTGAWIYVRLTTDNTRSLPATPMVWLQVLLVLVLAGLSLTAGGHLDDSFPPLWVSLGFSVALASLMISIALGPSATQLPFANRTVRKLGDISYGIYLIHMVLVAALGDWLSLPTDGTAAALGIWLAVILSSSIAYGYLSARFLEQPIRRWARQFGRREPTGPGSPK